jgi:hypothetical protein
MGRGSATWPRSDESPALHVSRTGRTGCRTPGPTRRSPTAGGTAALREVGLRNGDDPRGRELRPWRTCEPVERGTPRGLQDPLGLRVSQNCGRLPHPARRAHKHLVSEVGRLQPLRSADDAAGAVKTVGQRESEDRARYQRCRIGAHERLPRLARRHDEERGSRKRGPHGSE